MKPIKFTYTRERMYPGFDKKTCKNCPHITYDGKDTAFLRYGMLLLSGSDVGVGSYVRKSTDGGKTFGEAVPFHGIEKEENGVRTKMGGGYLFYNKHHDKWLMFGKSISYENDKHPVLINGIAPGDPHLSFFNPETMQREPILTPIPFPFEYVTADPFSQPFEFDNGDMMLTFYYTAESHKQARVVSIRFALEGDHLVIVKVGEPIIVGKEHRRGVYEPSMTYLDGKYYIALRTDEIGMFAVSDDGYHFDTPRPYVWDDGSVLENYNTMQRWVRHPDGLFLVYNRKGAHNDHVFRHRAPLFMTRFDEDRQCLIRDEEIVVVPELGARLGNFYVTDVSDKEAWITVGEWMQPVGCEKYGSDNSIWRTKILFE